MTATTTTITTGDRIDAEQPAARPEISPLRLNLLRLIYLMMAVFLIGNVAPLLPQDPPTHMTSVARALLVGLGLLALLGLRYPLQMLPVLLFEFAWKAVWVITYGLPAYMSGAMEPAYASSFKDTGIGLLLLLALMPWGYVARRYVTARGEPWRMGRQG